MSEPTLDDQLHQLDLSIDKLVGGLIVQRDSVRDALRRLLSAIDDETANRDGEYLLPPDPGCIRCTVGVADSGKLCAYHEAEKALEGV